MDAGCGDFLKEKIKNRRIGNILMVYNRRKCGSKVIFYKVKLLQGKLFIALPAKISLQTIYYTIF